MIPNITRSSASIRNNNEDSTQPDAAAMLATHPKIRPPKFDEDKPDLPSPPPSPTMFPIHEAIYGGAKPTTDDTSRRTSLQTQIDSDDGGLRTPDPQRMKEICRTPRMDYDVSPLPSPSQFPDDVTERLTPADAEVVDISFFRLDQTYPPLDEKAKQEAGPLRQWRVVRE